MHVRMADESICVGPASAQSSYLNVPAIITAATLTNADGIHPGYGFLSENAEFARRCSQSGIVFIGPSAEAIEQMGAKDQAKCVMENAGIPIVYGYKGAEQSPEFLNAEAEKIGYPLVIKAVLGGGGKGMRVVRKQTDFSEALESARNEARNAFGDDRILLECFISGPRHIEFQIFGDQHGNVIHLFERDCSLQRRHQKIIEESPSPFLDDELRSSMAEAAVAAAKAVKYTGAGTVEFIVGDDRVFFFMEMNTRLQVEHPVTEMISGLDLVEWQLRVAAGEKLPLTQHEVNQTGHAIEARIYAENPETGFLPSIGTLHCLAFPDIFHKVKKIEDNNSQSWSSIRIDSGVEQGGEISIHYDPLIAKLVVHADSRKQAIRTMQTALAQSGVLGVETNLGFLQSILQHPYFDTGKMDTLFVDSNLESLLEENQDSVDWVCWGAAIACLLEDYAESETKAWESIEPCSPWNSLNNWRASFPEPHRVQLRNQQGTETEVMIIKENNSFRILNETEGILVTVSRHGDLLDLSWNTNGLEESGHHLLVLMNDLQVLTVHEKGRNYFTRLDPLAYEQSEEVSDFRLSAPMPGNVIRVLVKAGDEVSSGQPLLVMEAMKMESEVKSPQAGVVQAVYVKEGTTVQTGDALLSLRG